ncbi:MAG: hypothetical protein CM1200mP39_25870 [Dehalococcoidia bacterium]|nr:MAG: hypothetical protein CM1200mP39_25870 [Dehalococcoidia bacterium]
MRIVSGSIKLDGLELTTLQEKQLRQLRVIESVTSHKAQRRFQPGASSDRQFSESPVQHGKMNRPELQTRGGALSAVGSSGS